jgi:hypothetical protein
LFVWEKIVVMQTRIVGTQIEGAVNKLKEGFAYSQDLDGLAGAIDELRL